jgi:small ligand-binding sensory domain FIST
LVGTGAEAEGATGFSLLLLDLPETKLHTAELTAGDLENSTATPDYWHRITGVHEGDVDAWTVLADPTAFPVEPWINEWNAAYPGIASIGGIASGGKRGDDIFLMRDRHVIEGAVAIGYKGGVRIETLVSQGCRPIGEPFTITGAEQNFVLSLGSRPAYEILQETFEALPDTDKELAQGNIFAGLAMSEYVDEYKTGDFLVRNLLGADPEHGVLALGAYPRVGQTLQFQLRDRRSADVELRHLASEKEGRPFASLLFPCSGRGKHLFGTVNHDAEVLREIFGTHASAGFFCNGEIGPVGGKNFVHGYTASAALFTNL